MSRRSASLGLTPEGSRQGYTPRVAPPSTVMQMPVRKEALAEARKQTRSAMSSGRVAPQGVGSLRFSPHGLHTPSRGGGLLFHQLIPALGLGRRRRDGHHENVPVTRKFEGAPRSARPLVKFTSAAFAVPPTR